MIRVGPNSLLAVATRRVRADEEHAQQVALFVWAERDAVLEAHPELAALYAVPNWFGVKTARQGGRAKAEGRKAGVPDVVLPVPRGGYGALYVEMKTATGDVSPAQRAWHELLRELGNRVEVCRSWESARDVILSYLTLPPDQP